MAMSDRARRLLLTVDGVFLAVVGSVQILFELVGYYRGAGPFGELFGLLGGQHQTEPKYRTRVIPRAALWISQKMTPRPDGVVTEAVTVWPAAIDLVQRPPRNRSTSSPAAIGVSSPRLIAAPWLKARRAVIWSPDTAASRDASTHRFSHLPARRKPARNPAVPVMP